MREHILFAKKSKCVFGTSHVEYLGHVISAQGEATDSAKIQAMQTWPVPKNIKQLRGFLGLTGSSECLFLLKEAMINALVLGLPYFNIPFLVEIDASGVGIGAVLQQNGHPIAHLSKTLSTRHQALSTYEKKFLAVLLALEKWRGYLLDRHFVIKTDHYSVKYLLNQRITTLAQMKWLPKLIGFDYEVIYKQGKDNVVADALSRKEREGECLHINITTVSTALYNQVKQTWLTDNHLKAICHQLKEGQIKKHYSLVNDQLLRKRKLVVGTNAQLRQELLNHFHGGSIGIRKEVKQMVKECLVCQKYKPDLAAYPGLLQPLPIPKSVWSSISMDFIKGLPKSQGYNVIMVVVDRLTKYTHLMPLAHPFTAVQVAQAFMDNVCKLHGMPESIVSDRDKVFLSLFWKELFGLLKVKLLMSSAYHPQTDKQNEVVKICLETYLRCMTGDLPKEYSKWLSLAELWYNSNYHSAIQTTAF
ncbi:transposon ty3-G gag-pol polyprotein, partial [Tanacetum coccineum]